MEKFSLTGGFKKLKSDLAGMSGKEKLAHLWTYYKVWLIVAVLVIMGLSLVFSIIVNKNTTTLASGMLVNLELSEEGKAYLKDELFEELKSGGGLEKVQLNESYLTSTSNAQTAENNYYTIVSITGLAVTGELDYVIMDKFGMESLVPQELFADLRLVLTEQELTALGDAVLYAREEKATESMPVVVDITSLAFVQENMELSEGDVVYIGFTKGTERMDMYRLIWDRLQNWE